MKTLKFISYLMIAGIFITSCSVHSSSSSSSGKIPPGQAKKMSGSKSAKNHAPGHQKKH